MYGAQMAITSGMAVRLTSNHSCVNLKSFMRARILALPMRPVIVLLGLDAAPHKTAPTPPCLRARSSTLCQCRRAGLLVADDVCAGHCMAQAP
jgi:hypothetical protein